MEHSRLVQVVEVLDGVHILDLAFGSNVTYRNAIEVSI